MDWSTFYLAVSGAAATLMGLLFIAIQFNIDIFAAEPGNQWRAMARSTFINFLVIFFLPLFLLIPGLDNQVHGSAIIIIALFGAARIILAWLPVWGGAFRGHRERLLRIAWLQIGPLLAYVVIALVGLQLLQGQQSRNSQQNFAYAVLGLFALVLRNSWNLLVEVTYEKKRGGAR